MELDCSCVFGDLTELYGHAEWPAEVREKIKFSQVAPMYGFMWCDRHGRYCPLRQVTLDVTGTPCTDYSRANRARRGIYGDTFPVLLTWAQLVQRLQVPIWFHENVLGQPTEIFNMLYDTTRYRIFEFQICPAQVGFSLIERERRYLMGIDVRKVSLLADPTIVLQAVVETLSSLTTEPRHALLADLHEVAEEARNLCQRKDIDVPAGVNTWTSAQDVDLTMLLNPRERKSLKCYTQKYVARFGHDPESDANAFFYLGDNAHMRTTWSCVSGRLPTLRTSSGKLWSPCARRWLTHKELLAAMGFPTYPVLAQAMGVSIMEFDSVANARAFLGNAMHAGVAGVVIAVGLSCVKVH